MWLRQVALVAHELDPVVERLEKSPWAEDCVQ